MLDTVTLRRTSRISSGHLWIFSNEIVESLKNYEPGSIVRVFDRNRQFIGMGYINPHSLISVRLLSRKEEPIDAGFFKRRLEAAFLYRKRFLTDMHAYRLVYSEGDLLPGLIVDVYGKVMVVQLLTLGMECLSESILNVLEDVFKPDTIVLRNDSQTRTLEGISLYKKILKGQLTSLPVIRDGDIDTEIDPLEGQKTGAFLDQRFNRIYFASLLSKGSKGLDLFCYSGPWGCHALKVASEVTFVDSSAKALYWAERNVRMNALAGEAYFVKEDVFDFLKLRSLEPTHYDFVILDPPAFVKSKNNIKEGIKAYGELNSMALSLLKEGGLLATSSCSHHIDRNIFWEIIQRSAREQHKQVRALFQGSQAIDHPILIGMTETEYLKCLFLEVRSA